MVEVQPDSNTRLVESKKRVAVNVKVVSSLRDFARSYAANWPPPAPATEESAAVDILKREWRNRSEHCPSYEGYESKKPMLIADLHDFEIFRSPLAGKGTRKFELTSLHLMETPTHKKLCFDGFLCVGDVKLYAKGMPIQNFSIEGYGDKESPETVTYLRSELASKDRDYDIWYRLNKPSQAYQRYHEPFLSIAELAKHVIDYIEEQPLGSVGLESFRKDFQEWLKARFSQNPAIEKWHLGFQNRTDFRVDVNAYIGFLYLEALSLPNSDALLRHPLWADCMARGLTAVEKQDQLEEYTVASPDVYKDFRDMYFGKKLKVMPTTEAVKRRQVRRKIRLGFATNEPPSAYAVPRCRPYRDSQIQIGDVVAFDPKEHDKVSWRNANWEWLACVQSIQPLNNGAQRLFVLFMYRPRETNIFNAKYSFDNELFFSDNCNCTDGELLSTDIKGKYEIDWLPKKIESNKGFFVRQTYLTQQSAFVSFKDDHKLCDCKKTKVYPLEAYHLGDTVYITKTVGGERILEPVVIRHTDKATGTVTVRRLSRLSRDCAQLAREAKRTADIADNELALTDDYVKVLASRIQRRCQVRFVPKQDVLRGKVPFPYNRGGAGDCWFISMGIISSEGGSRLKYLTRLPERFNESEGLAAICGVEKLKGLSMFSGGGNLDRGLEEGGVVEFRYAIDLDPQAIHTQRANAKDFTRLNLYYGSVDDYMKLVLSGIKHDHVARIGDVEFIAAGSPCPGFSSLQQNIFSETSLKNASHITSFCTAVDILRPQYAVLENVVSMAYKRKGFEEQNVLSQLVACLVGLGYQVNQYIMDSWSYGSGQHRCRIILTIAAPGLEPITKPFHTHSRPSGDTVGRSLGELPNGQRFGQREQYATPFTHLSASVITSDLPDIGNGNIKTCIKNPDHRVSQQPGPKDRALLRCIPRYPPGCGYKEAHDRGLIPLSLQKSKKETGKAFKRIKEFGLVPTITTNLNMQDSRNGAIVHWSQDRPITILEARRTQGYLDEEPIIGDLIDQYRIIGNGVDRKVSFALGRALCQSVVKNIQRNEATGVFTESTEEILVDAEEDVDNMHVLLRKTAAVGLSTSVARLEQQLISRGALSHPDKCAATIRGLDGNLVARQPNPPLKAIGLWSCASATSSTVTQDLARRPKQLPAEPRMVSSDFKRSRDDEEIGSRKRTKTSNTALTSAFFQAEEYSSETNRTKSRTRYTRHSGLNIAFVPKQWNKLPEREQTMNLWRVE